MSEICQTGGAGASMLEMRHASRRLAPPYLLLADRVQHALGVYRASVLGKDAPDESMRGVYPSLLFQGEFHARGVARRVSGPTQWATNCGIRPQDVFGILTARIGKIRRVGLSSHRMVRRSKLLRWLPRPQRFGSRSFCFNSTDSRIETQKRNE